MTGFISSGMVHTLLLSCNKVYFTLKSLKMQSLFWDRFAGSAPGLSTGAGEWYTNCYQKEGRSPGSETN